MGYDINENKQETESKKEKKRKRTSGKEKRKKNKSEKKRIVWNKRALRKGTYSATFSVVVIAIIVVLNMIVGQIPSKYTQFDISTGKLYTIGDETREVLKNLDEDITIYYVVQTGNEENNIEKLLAQYEESSSKVKVEKKDPVENPTFVKQYTTDQISENSLIVVGGKRSKVVDYNSLYETEIDYSTYQSKVTGFDGEGQITSAIAYVISDELPVIYYVEGHNEVDLPESLTDRIEKANLELKELNLVTAENVPEDAAGILLNSPETDYSKEEADKVISYLQNGGKAIILTDYIGKELTNYNSILTEYGIEITDGIVIEKDSNMYVQRPYYLVPEISASEVTTGMTGGSSNVLLSGCQGFSIAEDVRDTLEVSTILSPSEDAFIKTDPQNMNSYDKEEGDADGPFIVAAVISETVSGTDESEEDSEEESVSEEKMTQIACFASSSILDASMNSMVSDGNYTLYMNSLTWMVDTGETDMVSIASKSVSTDYLTVTAGSAALVALLFCILLPIVCLVAGGVICYRRKKR